MNPLTKVKLINELNQREADLGVQDNVSWHAEYKDSAWIFLGGLPYELTEGDIICVFSQYGDIVNINLVRDQKTGKSKGFCFICYEDQRSTILAVDNFNGIKIKGRTIRVDHVANYRPPKDTDDIDDITKTLREKGCRVKTPPPSSESLSEDETPAKKVKDKKEKRKKKKEKKKIKKEKAMVVLEQPRLRERNSPLETKIKKEKEDSGYNKCAVTIQDAQTQRDESKPSRDERNERSLGKDSGREQQKDDRSRDQRGDKNRYDHRMDRDQMNAEWRNERRDDRGWKDDKRDDQDRKGDRCDDRGRREDRQDNRTSRQDRPDEREWRENRQNDRSRRDDKLNVRDSGSGKSKERHRETSRHFESHYELHSSGRDDKAFYSESSSSSSQSRQRIDSMGRDRQDNREQYGVSENRRH